uniref:BRF2-like C-terminal domain-containing protein n=1 Tax=Rhizophora mucronata TaxID=61149 RepID=A0A2P2IKC7_RHIMU
MPCYSCGHRSLVRDDVTGSLVCECCGAVQEFDSFESRICGAEGLEGVFVKVGTSGTGSSLNYRDKKIYEAHKLIDEITSKLNISGQRVADIKNMISQITVGELGQGDWFSVLIGACAYVTMRSNNRPLSIAETSNVIGCDVHELGRMVTRVIDHLSIKLPEFDIESCFERVVRNLFVSGRVENDRVERMRKQGVFLIQCMVKWFLTTGRRPLPVVAAVLILVAELNDVQGLTIEQVARDVHSAVSTCRSRYKELLEALVKVAQALPWGKNVTVKNVVKNAPSVIRYMEMKSRAKHDEKGKSLDNDCFDLGEVVGQCLRKDVLYGVDDNSMECNDSRYFELEDKSGFDKIGVDDGNKLQLSHECLFMLYDKFLECGGGKHIGESGLIHRKGRNHGLELYATDWWNEKSDLGKKLVLKQILERDVGLDAMPPSFVNGCKAIERRRARINAAKLRIDKVMCPQNDASIDFGSIQLLEGSYVRKRKRKTKGNNLDWEDFIVETLLLHQVKEEEIEKGHYNTLLDLHVFNSGVM